MVLKIERFQPAGMNVRMSGGKPSYSHVVTVSGSGKIVYTAGQLARDVDGNCVGKGDMRAQMEQTFQNLDRCLKAAGATWADVVKTNTFVTDFDEFQKCACKGACSYPVLFNAFKRLASGTSTAEKADLFAGTASPGLASLPSGCMLNQSKTFQKSKMRNSSFFSLGNHSL